MMWNKRNKRSRGKKHTAVLGILSMTAMLLTGCVSQSKEIEDTVVTESTNETRIVATSVATLEILDALEIDGVVGIPETSYEIPERYADATKVGTPMSPDMEIVKSLNPTFVLSPKSLETDLASSYEAIGVSSVFLNLSSVEGMYQSIEGLGELFGAEENAAKLVEEYETFFDKYQEAHSADEQPTVLILMGLPGSYVVATENSYVGNLVKLAGGINVYEGISSEEFVNINTEDMVQTKPDIILRTAHALPDQVMAMFAEEFETNDIWKHFEAVQEGNVYDLDSTKFGMSATLDYQEAIADLESIFYGK